MSTLEIVPTGEATGALYLENRSPVRVFGTEAIRKTFGEETLRQARNARLAPGVTEVVLTPDAHVGFGAPIGCVMTSPDYIYPGPVGVDINCSMSLLQFELPEEELVDKKLRRAIIEAIERRVPTGAGLHRASCGRNFPLEALERGVCEGATPEICELLQIPKEWATRCEVASNVGHDGTKEALAARLEYHKSKLGGQDSVFKHYESQLRQIGSYGGGNHFGECEIVRLSESEKDAARDPQRVNVAQTFGLLDGNAAFLSHCGSRGFGNALAKAQFALLKKKFELWHIPMPGDDPQLVYAPVGTKEADDYIDDMSLGANFSTLNHLTINSLVLEAFQEVIPGLKGSLVYYISHNVARQEIIDAKPVWIHRKGATRAYPAGHFALRDTPFAATGHPILLPGNPTQGSSVMVALEGAKSSLYSVNHGAGRALGRREACKTLVQNKVDSQFTEADILTNCRQYPLDEAPAAYKDFNEVLRSVELAGLAREVARLQARFVIKDAATPDD